MLSMRIDTLPHTSWEWHNGRWCSGRSWIAPYDHPALDTWSVHDSQRTIFQVRERLPGQQAHAPGGPRPVSKRAYDQALAEATAWAGAHHLIEISPQGITLRTGARCPAPVYLAVRQAALHAHWDITQLRDSTTDQNLDPIGTARLLALTGHYSTRTAWAGIRLLTEQSTACFHDGELTVDLPEASRHDQARELAPTSRVLDGYETLLDAVLADLHYLPERTAIELSGGMDSSNVAMSLARRHGAALVSGALLQEGAAGAQQQRRREAMIRYAGFRDTLLRAADYLPMDPRHASSSPLGPHEEIYIAGHSTLLAKWHADGMLWSATGVGGDEMLSLPPEPRSPLAKSSLPPWLTDAAFEALQDQEAGVPPAPPISDSTLRAMACGAPMYLRAGLWPLYPLADVTLWRFGQWLPFSWRRNKRLARARLQRLGFPPEVAHPLLRENFQDVLHEALHRFAPQGLHRLLSEGSPLLEVGYLNADELAAAAERIEAQRMRDTDAKVVHVLRLHQALI
ncbi:hypothetical protein [Streptomyces sp. NPDC050485]|uniref:hypothetical protein n=1 Tax=Streptomyces sp. NPDC050485 TaxID=3365617 RepID=UPI0037A42E1C